MSVEARDVTVEVGGRVILAPTSLSVTDGSSLAVVGPSGSGKSTLLDCLSGWRTATSGTVHVGGVELGGLSSRARDRWRRDTIGVVMQEPGLLEELTIAENVDLVRRFRAEVGAPWGASAADLLTRVGLGGRGGEYPSTLSGGEAQRVAVARGVASARSALIADEPTASLDRRNADSVIDLLVELTAEHCLALVVATHDPAVAARCHATIDLA